MCCFLKNRSIIRGFQPPPCGKLQVNESLHLTPSWRQNDFKAWHLLPVTKTSPKNTTHPVGEHWFADEPFELRRNACAPVLQQLFNDHRMIMQGFLSGGWSLVRHGTGKWEHNYLQTGFAWQSLCMTLGLLAAASQCEPLKRFSFSCPCSDLKTYVHAVISRSTKRRCCANPRPKTSGRGRRPLGLWYGWVHSSVFILA